MSTVYVDGLKGKYEKEYEELFTKNGMKSVFFIAKRCTTDEELFRLLLKYGKDQGEDDAMYYRTRARISEIKKVLSNRRIFINKNGGDRYLDVGCYDGKITAGIANFFKIRKGNVYGVDVETWAGKENVVQENTITQISHIDEKDPVLPYSDNFFDFVSCLQVLHHTFNPQKLIAEMKRVTKPGGVIIVREHDALEDKHFKILTDFEHIFYMLKENTPEEFKKRLEKYFSEYSPANKWDKMFNIDPLSRTDVRGPTRYYTTGYINYDLDEDGYILLEFK